MPDKKLKPIHCKSLICNEYLCHSDGVFLYVENLEIAPQTRRGKKRFAKILSCPRCGWRSKIYLRKPDDGGGDDPPKKGKFSIFRSRFD